MSVALAKGEVTQSRSRVLAISRSKSNESETVYRLSIKLEELLASRRRLKIVEVSLDMEAIDANRWDVDNDCSV